MRKFKKLKISILPLELQREIVSILDTFDAWSMTFPSDYPQKSRPDAINTITIEMSNSVSKLHQVELYLSYSLFSEIIHD